MAAHLHLSRITCRKAERSVWKALALLPNSVNTITGKYLNRLADLLYILARFTKKNENIFLTPDMHKTVPSDYQILIEL